MDEDEFINWKKQKELQSKLHSKPLPSKDTYTVSTLHSNQEKNKDTLHSKPSQALLCKKKYPANRKRNVQKKIYFSPDEWLTVSSIIDGFDFSLYIRSYFLNRRPLHSKTTLINLFKELSYIGNNLNQLTKRANESRSIQGIEELKTFLKALSLQLSEIREELDRL